MADKKLTLPEWEERIRKDAELQAMTPAARVQHLMTAVRFRGYRDLRAEEAVAQTFSEHDAAELLKPEPAPVAESPGAPPATRIRPGRRPTRSR